MYVSSTIYYRRFTHYAHMLCISSGLIAMIGLEYVSRYKSSDATVPVKARKKKD
jgi:hypothetical protein